MNKYFSYNPEIGIEFHETLDQAKQRSIQHVDDAIFHAEDSDFMWHDNEEEICYGELKGQCIVHETLLKDGDELKKEYPELDYTKTLSLEDVGSSELKHNCSDFVSRSIEEVIETTDLILKVISKPEEVSFIERELFEEGIYLMGSHYPELDSNGNKVYKSFYKKEITNTKLKG